MLPGSRARFLRTTASGGAALFGASIAVGRADAVFRMSIPEAQTHPIYLSMVSFAQLVARNSHGALKVELYPNGSLAREQDSVNGLQTGTIDMCVQTTAYLESIVKRIQALDLPFLFRDRKTAERMLDGEVGKQISTELAQRGIITLAWGTAGWRQITFTEKRVSKPEDMRGLRVRIQNGAVYASMMKALGAIPIVIDIAETYLALQQKTVDGLDLPLLSLLTQNFYQVAKHITLTNHLYNPQLVLMSKQRFDGLAPDQQRVLVDAGASTQRYLRNLVADAQAGTLQALKDKGLTVDQIDYPAFRTAMNPVYAEYREKLGAEAFDAIMRQSQR